ncbi:MAG: hypothetical protein AAF327_21055 [Cyanobacteria bacterium P01_A01_bin.37]
MKLALIIELRSHEHAAALAFLQHPSVDGQVLSTASGQGWRLRYVCYGY